ncbi:hypothetical protein AB0J21_21110 [Streptomyces sp. NPDC049954]|uniref:hypothetical protein n=1 Tax=Streptomyces sp. NPDC049954 TaxID=3155779 RepID=UPI00344620BD
MTAFRTPAPALAATTAVLAALCVTLVVTLGGDTFPEDAALLSYQYGACWLLFGGAALALRKVPVRAVAAVVLTGGIAVAVTGLVSPPTTSTDSSRYAWDGRVQAAGISPYDHTPADPALAALRDPWLFPVGPACADHERPGLAAPEDPARAARRLGAPRRRPRPARPGRVRPVAR